MQLNLLSGTKIFRYSKKGKCIRNCQWKGSLIPRREIFIKYLSEIRCAEEEESIPFKKHFNCKEFNTMQFATVFAGK